MSVAIFCPKCLGSIIPQIVPTDELRIVYDWQASMKTQQVGGVTECQLCGETFGLRASYNLRGEFRSIDSVEGYELRSYPCPRCHNIGPKKIIAGPLFLPPTGGDYEWVDTTAESFCPICEAQFRSLVRIDLATRDFELTGFDGESASWETQFVLAKVYYARGEPYSTETARSFSTKEELLEYWKLWREKLLPLANHPSTFSWELMELKDGNYSELS